MTEPTGSERIRAAIEMSRGAYAPAQPVRLCGEPDPNAMRADDPRWPGNQRPRRDRLVSAAVNAIMCPACLRPRCNPAHWLTC